VKIRVQNNPIEVRVWKAFGAIPTPMNFGEVYQALQSGVLDAAENGLAVISRTSTTGGQYISQTAPAQLSPCTSTRRSSSMPPDLQKIVLDAAPRPPPRAQADASSSPKRPTAEPRARCSRRRTSEVHRAHRADPGRGEELKARTCW
jgi:hypothetical protein